MFELRISLSKLRVSSHRLIVESGRWMKPQATPFENRKCKICGVLEDEYHFVLECLLYVDIRKIYLHRYFWNRPNMIKFIELLTTDNKKKLKNLSIIQKRLFVLEKKICRYKAIHL